MNAIRPPHRAPKKVPGVPQPAARNAREDWASRYLADGSRRDLSDRYPAGQTPIVSSETPQRGGSEARLVRGCGVAVGGVPDRPSSRSDSTFADVPVKGMESSGGHARRVGKTATRRDVSLDVRLSKTEREAIRARARALGAKPSAWARAVMLDALDARGTREAGMCQTAHEIPNPELARAVEQLRRVGVNLNHALRKGQTVDAGLLRAVFDAVTEVRAVLGDWTAS